MTAAYDGHIGADVAARHGHPGACCCIVEDCPEPECLVYGT